MERIVLNRASSGYRSLKQAESGELPPVGDKDLMAPSKRITPFLLYAVYFVTLGPLLFGYHLVSVHNNCTARWEGNVD